MVLFLQKRREKINERLKTLQNLVPNGTKVDISTMLEEAVNYVKFLQLQIKLLSSDDLWMYAPLAYNGIDMGFHHNLLSRLTPTREVYFGNVPFSIDGVVVRVIKYEKSTGTNKVTISLSSQIFENKNIFELAIFGPNPRGLINHHTPSPSARGPSDLRSISADGRNNIVLGGSPVYQAAPCGPSSEQIVWYLDGDPIAYEIFPASEQL
ncbi:hypothetical protein YC2023_083394 [Brassica napus]